MQSYSGFEALLAQFWLEHGSYEPGVAGSSPARSNFFVFIYYNSNAYFLRLYYKLNIMARNQKSKRSTRSGSRKSRKYGKKMYKSGKPSSASNRRHTQKRILQRGG